MNEYLHINPEVESALRSNKPVVALESTIISHGMPYPKNVETAMRVEQIVRDHGAVPATIGVMNGKCVVGMTNEEIETFGKASDVWKVSLRDLPYVVSQNFLGATTVAATMRIASMAGIKIFVTGGIGGVHRGAEMTMDISADLTEMAQTNVAVISAGLNIWRPWVFRSLRLARTSSPVFIPEKADIDHRCVWTHRMRSQKCCWPSGRWD